MTSPRDILNRLKWKEGENISEAVVYYVHRGAPGDSKAVSGADIAKLEGFCFELNTGTCIPYHRIYKITYRGTTIFERHKK
ncbi:Uncharacterized protein conserved in archaea [Methanocella conradii HZ254]|uniref:Uncharacterized protein conserved in archaea n=1 Tax=Methanocella conradii (strain DSM 24694 / JCM 17849 / CGMCC 1.5162 / HZ254) TaxID=1041930 RepID=H8I4Z0_METCZ|nr:DUF504 domain-containing protein [Methanocella conradii]AFD01084.1 Uncharacterized protein conserved in archaea [Methanocella conradii HZ254]